MQKRAISGGSNLAAKKPIASACDLPMNEIQCPTCFETFEVASPSDDERPCEVDYDCEICCRPMVIVFEADGTAWARGLGEL